MSLILDQYGEAVTAGGTTFDIPLYGYGDATDLGAVALIFIADPGTITPSAGYSLVQSYSGYGSAGPGVGMPNWYAYLYSGADTGAAAITWSWANSVKAVGVRMVFHGSDGSAEEVGTFTSTNGNEPEIDGSSGTLTHTQAGAIFMLSGSTIGGSFFEGGQPAGGITGWTPDYNGVSGLYGALAVTFDGVSTCDIPAGMIADQLPAWTGGTTTAGHMFAWMVTLGAPATAPTDAGGAPVVRRRKVQYAALPHMLNDQMLRE